VVKRRGCFSRGGFECKSADWLCSGIEGERVVGGWGRRGEGVQEYRGVVGFPKGMKRGEDYETSEAG